MQARVRYQVLAPPPVKEVRRGRGWMGGVWLPPGEEEPKGIVVAFHGRGDTADVDGMLFKYMKGFLDKGYVLVQPEYPGFEMRDGNPEKGRVVGEEATIHRMASRGIELIEGKIEVRRLKVPIMILGFSLGTVMAARLARLLVVERGEGAVNKVVLVAPVTSLGKEGGVLGWSAEHILRPQDDYGGLLEDLREVVDRGGVQVVAMGSPNDPAVSFRDPDPFLKIRVSVRTLDASTHEGVLRDAVEELLTRA